MKKTANRPLTRRTLIGSVGAMVAASLTACSPRPSPRITGSTGGPVPKNDRILLAYFSRAGENYWNGGRRALTTGNTEVLAELIASRIDCDVLQILAADPYSDLYEPTVRRNVEEQDRDARPAIRGTLPDLSRYDTVLLGSPIWNVQPPMIMASFVDNVDLRGKHVVPFVTYAVSGLGSTQAFYRGLNTGSGLGAGLAIRGEDARTSAATDQVDGWLQSARLNS